MKTLENHPDERRKVVLTFSVPVSHTSRCMAFTCFETEITSKRKKNGSVTEDSAFPPWKGKMEFRAGSGFRLKRPQPGLRRRPNFLRANFKRRLHPQCRERSFLVSIRSSEEPGKLPSVAHSQPPPYSCLGPQALARARDGKQPAWPKATSKGQGGPAGRSSPSLDFVRSTTGSHQRTLRRRVT